MLVRGGSGGGSNEGVGHELFQGGHVRLAGYGGRDGGEHPRHATTHPADHGAGRLRGRIGHVISQAVHVPEGAQVGVGDAAVVHQLTEDGGQTPAAMMTVMPVHGGGGYGMTCGAGQGLWPRGRSRQRRGLPGTKSR